MAKLLAWISILLLAYLFTTVLIRRYLSLKGRNINTSTKLKLVKFRQYHRLAAIAALLLGLVHGYLFIGNRILLNHNGTLLWMLVLLAAAVAKLSGKYSLRWHVRLASIVFVVLLVHYFFPGALI